MKCNRISLCRITNAVPNTVCKQHAIDDFVEFPSIIISLCNVPKENMVNVDEMNVPFSVDSNASHATINSKTVLVKQANVSN